ncbi:MAG: hypothetical protein HN380_15920, partial [Victivallales bacterium]|nr:hypothetical protein [Victivallales bacterium]
SQAPMVSVTHFMDRDGQVLSSVTPRRYFCNQCHVPQLEVKPLVANDFIGNLVVGGEGELIRDDGSINSTWRGNLVHATGTAKPGYENAGIQAADPKLEQRDGIWRLPVAGSPAINPPSVNYHNVNAPPPGSATDIDGQPRDGKPDTGCDEAGAGPVRYPPLQPKDVGPAWMAGDPARLGRIPAPKPIPKIRKARKTGK